MKTRHAVKSAAAAFFSAFFVSEAGKSICFVFF